MSMFPGRPRLAVRRHRKVAVVLAVSLALALSGLAIEFASAATRSRLAVSLKSDRSNAVRHRPAARTTAPAPAATTTAPAPAATTTAPATTQQPVPSHLVPATLASNCSVDVTAALLKWIGSIPDNSILTFGAAKCYRIDGTVELSNRSGLILQGNGSTFKSGNPMVSGNKADDQRAMFRVIDSSPISLRTWPLLVRTATAVRL